MNARTEPTDQALSIDQLWEAELHRLESGIADAERTLAGHDVFVTDPWTPPEIGPLPAHLHDRARELHARQLDLMARLDEAMSLTRRQQAMANRVVQGFDSVTPIAHYCDINA